MYIFGGVNSLPLPPYRVTTLTSPLNPITTLINFYSREVSSLDLNNSLTSIKSRAGIGDMNIPKRNPYTVVLDGKICVAWCPSLLLSRNFWLDEGFQVTYYNIVLFEKSS